ncbi:MAG: hypothetical protein HC822_28195 [Oscillochloris sp.]|nr:hypothetical protein [Oscillochloris sp.]
MTFATPFTSPAASTGSAHSVELLVLLDPKCLYSRSIIDSLNRIVAERRPHLQLDPIVTSLAASLARRYRVSRIPALIFSRAGRPIGYFAGAASQSSIGAWLDYTLHGGVAPPALQGPSQPYCPTLCNATGLIVTPEAIL